MWSKDKKKIFIQVLKTLYARRMAIQERMLQVALIFLMLLVFYIDVENRAYNLAGVGSNPTADHYWVVLTTSKIIQNIIPILILVIDIALRSFNIYTKCYLWVEYVYLLYLWGATPEDCFWLFYSWLLDIKHDPHDRLVCLLEICIIVCFVFIIFLLVTYLLWRNNNRN